MRSLLIIAAALMFSLTARAETGCPAAGEYSVSGVTPEGKTYTGKTKLEVGPACDIVWANPLGEMRVGRPDNGVIMIGFLIGESEGTGVFKVAADGTFEGDLWLDESSSRVGHEILTPAGRQVAAVPPAGARKTAPAARASSGDIRDILEAYLVEDSKHWMMNRYDVGSMTNVTVKKNGKDKQVVRGNYTYNGGSAGWVEADVVGGEVQCFRYWDFADRCRKVGTSSPAFGIALGVAVAAATSSGGGSGGGASSYDDYDQQQTGQSSYEAPASESRSYGLYGNCPQSGAGYGC